MADPTTTAPGAPDPERDSMMEVVYAAYNRIRADRGEVYGDPRENHKGIAQIWAPILMEHWETIRDGEPVPEWVVALMMVGLKYDRMRIKFHPDNFIDLVVYLSFAWDWQRSDQQAKARMDKMFKNMMEKINGKADSDDQPESAVGASGPASMANDSGGRPDPRPYHPGKR